jgi:hypothetical protein
MAQALIDPHARAESLSIESLAALWRNLNSNTPEAVAPSLAAPSDTTSSLQ